uniref:Tritrans,polycis-undecaprenyl-diphosphate synthase (geranylgeranyl-diphosphate specific) n=1 Tax=Geoglobus ahangari TaxID=113653 RepID=A0A7C3YPK2_9EURY
MIRKLYELKLLREIKRKPLPKHLAIIMDGNRRFARSKGLPEFMGHVFGSKKAERVLEWCREIGIKTLTMYAFSTENFKRKEEEKKNIFELAKKELKRLIKDERTHKYRMRVKIVGRRELLPPDVLEVVEEVERVTKNYDNYFLNVALAYGGRQEIVDAIRSILKDVKEGKISIDEIDENIFSRYLYSDNGYENVDIVIRTGGELRLSNFLPWQTASSLTYFVDVYWPAFRKIDLLRAIRTWQNIRARYINR